MFEIVGIFFVSDFLKHLWTIWSQFFVSPYVVPAVALLVLRWRQTGDGSDRSFLVTVTLYLTHFAEISIGSSLLISLGVPSSSPAELLAWYALHFYFNSTAISLDPSLFYEDICFQFWMIFCIPFPPLKKSVPVMVIASFLLLCLCWGLAFGIQHFVYLLNFGWSTDDVALVANFSFVAAVTLWIGLVLSVQYLSVPFQRLINRGTTDTIEPIVRIVITVLILAFALSGFFFLQPFQATLWLLFWIIAYPVALSFTRGEPLKGAALTEIYVAGLKQVPVLGQIFAAYMGKPSHRPPDSPPENKDPPPDPKIGP
jgi:hypothetical protein